LDQASAQQQPRRRQVLRVPISSAAGIAVSIPRSITVSYSWRSPTPAYFDPRVRIAAAVAVTMDIYTSF
jgi:hypothetical protein